MRFVLGLWLVFITLLSLSPYHLKIWLGTTGHLHEAGHVLAFALTTLLICWLVPSVTGKLLRCAAVFAFAMFLEAFEMLVYHAPFEWEDIALDTLGILGGCLILLFAERVGMLRRDRAELPPEL